jgi:hypothetical protein
MIVGLFPYKINLDEKGTSSSKNHLSLEKKNRALFSFIKMSSDSVFSNDSSVVSSPVAEDTTVHASISVAKKPAAKSKPLVEADKKPPSRFRWPSMELRVTNDIHGSKRDTYPFLNDSNEHDKALTRNLLVYRPFLQKKGEQTAAWNNVVEMCLEATTVEGGPVFDKNLNVKSAKKRFLDYMSFMKSYRAKKPMFNSGGDNEPYPDILRALEDLYDLYDSFKNASEEKRSTVVDARARDRVEGEAIRNASLGIFVAARSDEETENQNDNIPAVASGGTNKATKPGRRQSLGRNSAGENNIQSLENIFEKYTKEKEESKRRRLEIEERKVALEEKRVEQHHQMMMTLIGELTKKN